MPNIVIKEYDKTTASSVLDNNFTVVVPGYIAAGKSTSCFDENGIYRCNSLVDFENNIGKVEQTIQSEGVGPTLDEINPTAVKPDDKTYGVLSASKFFENVGLGIIYKRTAIDTPIPEREGFLLKKVNTGTEEAPVYQYFKYTVATKDDWKDVTYSEATPFDTSTTYSKGIYVTYQNQLYICIEAHPAGEFSYDHFEATPKFSIIQKGNEGINYGEATQQVGNQVAYLLLKLGYEVLYLYLSGDRLITATDIWEPLKDRAVYDFRYIVSGLIDNQTTMGQVNDIIVSLAGQQAGRGDCLALLDLPKSIYAGKTSASAVAAIKANLPSTANQYSAIFAPTVIYNLSDAGFVNNELPASFHYLACAAYAFERYPEWYAVSGYQRGVCSMNIAGPTVKFGDSAINALQQRNNLEGLGKAVNLIIKLGDAYYLWGNRTAYALDGSDLVASHFLNIRQLCSTLKKAIYSTCRHLMFDPNSDILWLNFCNAIRPILEKMKANQGIKDFRFERKETVKKGKLFAAIRIIPIEAVEDFEIGITLEDNFDVTSVSIEETI